MKWITPIWSDPVGWSDQVAKTKLRVSIWILFHIVFMLAGFLMMYSIGHRMGDIGDPRISIILAISVGVAPILFIGVGFPALYLYAIYRLLGLLRDKDNGPQNKPMK